MSLEEIRGLFDYNTWANRRSLDAAAALTNEQFLQPMGSSFSSVRDTLAHIYSAEWIWLERFHGNSPSTFLDTSNLTDIASLKNVWQEQDSRLQSYIRGLKPADLECTHEYKTLNYGVYSNPLRQSLQHLANHGTYHRGQVATLIRQHGAKPIPTDLLHYYRERATTVGA